MGAQDLSSITVAQRTPGLFGGATTGPTVVWLRGEHDVANAGRLTQVIAETIAMDEEDVIIDLSGVEFMSGSTIAIFMRASTFLSSRSRSLVLRAPRPHALRLLGLCGLSDLVEPDPAESVQMTVAADALRTWVAVPATARTEDGPPERAPAAAAQDSTATGDPALAAVPVPRTLVDPE